MGRFAMFVAAVTLVFASPAVAQNSGTADVEATVPGSAAQGQYEPGGPSTVQSIKEGIEEAIEDAEENNAAADGTEAYLEELSPEEADAAEAAEEPVGSVEAEGSVEPGASAHYQSLPDTGGPSLPLAAALVAFLAGGTLVWRRMTRSE